MQSHSECQNLLTLEVFIKAVMARAYAKDDKKLLEDLQAVWARIEDAANNNPCLWGDIHALTSFPFFQKASLIEVLINTPWKNKLLEVFQDLAPVEKKAFHKRLIH